MASASVRRRPPAVAKFVADCASLGIERLWPAVQEISQSPSWRWGWPIRRSAAQPPRPSAKSPASRRRAPGPSDRKQRFKSLPYDLQVYVAAHEAQREKALRRAQNEAATAQAETGGSSRNRKTRTTKREMKPMTPRTRNRRARRRLKIASGGSAPTSTPSSSESVEAVAKENPGVPSGVIRNLLTARAPACACAQYLELERQR